MSHYHLLPVKLYLRGSIMGRKLSKSVTFAHYLIYKKALSNPAEIEEECYPTTSEEDLLLHPLTRQGIIWLYQYLGNKITG